MLVVALLPKVALHHVGQGQRATAQLRFRHDANVEQHDVRSFRSVVEPPPLEASVEYGPCARLRQRKGVVSERGAEDMVDDEAPCGAAYARQAHVSGVGAQPSRLEVQRVHLPRSCDAFDYFQRARMRSHEFIVLTVNGGHSNVPSGLSRTSLLHRSAKPPVGRRGLCSLEHAATATGRQLGGFCAAL